MPRAAKGAHLWLRPSRRDQSGKLTHSAVYVILDGGSQVSTGCIELERAQAVLAAYITKKYQAGEAATLRNTTAIPVADVIAKYAADVAAKAARPKEVKERLERLLSFFSNSTLFDINGELCRQYVRESSTDAMARRDLEDLRSAINHHRREGLHDRIVSVVMPERRPARERWLDRSEAAKLLWTAWRRPKCKHVAKFTLVAIYTGRRASVVCRASFIREIGRPFVDLATGMLWPPERARKTKKRNPPIRLSEKLLIHLRAWHRNGQRYVVEWAGRPVIRIDRAVKEVAVAAELEGVTPHVYRHTAATWQMQAGTDIWEASRYLGMTVRTLETTYGHHRPEHLTSAVNVHQRHRRAKPPTLRQRIP